MRRFYPYLVAALTLLATSALAWSIHSSERAAAAAMLRDAAHRIEQRIGSHILLLHSLKGLFVSLRGEVSRETFSRFLSAVPIDRTMAGIQGVGFARAVRPDAPGAATLEVAQGYGLVREPWPATTEEIRFPIVILEPSDERNRAALNYDMFSEERRRSAMLEAWRTGLAAATEPVQLVQEIDAQKQVGFLIYVPLYRSELLAIPAEHEADAIMGFVYAPFRAGDLFATVLGETPPLRVKVHAYSGHVTEETRLFANADAIAEPVTHTISVAGRTWVLLLGESGEGGWLPSRPVLLVLVLGCLLALAGSLLVRAQTRALETAEALAAETRARVAEKDILLQEMNHRLKNLYARTLAVFRLNAVQAASLEGLVHSFGNRLQAMAKAQDSIAHSHWQRISLRTLLDQEIGHLAGGERVVQMDGPEVGLDEVQSQAMGLVAHELATNSLKYGALAGSGALEITWRSESGEIFLEWCEEGLATRPDFAADGFGSRLVHLMIEKSLRGSLERTVDDDRLRYRIRFPLRKG